MTSVAPPTLVGAKTARSFDNAVLVATHSHHRRVLRVQDHISKSGSETPCELVHTRANKGLTVSRVLRELFRDQPLFQTMAGVKTRYDADRGSDRISTQSISGKETESASAMTGRLSASRYIECEPFAFFGQQRSAPTTGTERGNCGQGQNIRPDRQNRSMGRVVVGGRTSRCGQQRAITNQLGHPYTPIDADFQPRSLRSGTQQRYLVDGQSASCNFPD